MIKSLNLSAPFFLNLTINDVAEPWSLFFQDNANPQIEGLEELHNNIMFYLAIVLFAVSWIMLSIIINYKEAKVSNDVNHGTLVELIWTITPALILVLIAFPSFKLLYFMDEVIHPSLTIYGEGHQWYWSYQYPDFTNNDEEFVVFDSYIVPKFYFQDVSDDSSDAGSLSPDQSPSPTEILMQCGCCRLNWVRLGEFCVCEHRFTLPNQGAIIPSDTTRICCNCENDDTPTKACQLCDCVFHDNCEVSSASTPKSNK